MSVALDPSSTTAELLNHTSLILAAVPDQQTLFEQAKSKITWHQELRSRWHANFGKPYNYNVIQYNESELPSWLDELRVTLEQLCKHPLNNCLANYYHNGSSTMGYHVDAYQTLHPDSKIVILSLGSTRTLTFRHQVDRAQITRFSLHPGSVFMMDRFVQQHWKHAILEEDCNGERISLTFRQVVG